MLDIVPAFVDVSPGGQGAHLRAVRARPGPLRGRGHRHRPRGLPQDRRAPRRQHLGAAARGRRQRLPIHVARQIRRAFSGRGYGVRSVRRPRSLAIPFLVVLLPVLLVVGVWLGGHSEYLPGFARDVLVNDDRGRVYDEAIDEIADNFYRPVDRDHLLDESLAGAVKSLDDRFSAYFDPKAYTEFNEATHGAFEGVGMTVAEAERGLRVVTVFDGSPAEKAGIRA